MGGGQKVGNNSNGNRGGRVSYSFWFMLLIAFGAAMLGVMVVHKLRERRIFSLLIKEKDHQLLSLQTLLQKEKVYNKEMTMKVEDMKRNIYSIRTEKMRLHKMVARMQSTIKSLKDEVETMESTVDEKENEIKLLKEREITVGKDKHQLIQLLESLKQKEAEINDLKSQLARLAIQVKVSSDNDDNEAESDLRKGNNTISEDESEIKVHTHIHDGGAEVTKDIVLSSVEGEIGDVNGNETITEPKEVNKTGGKGDSVRKELDQKYEENHQATSTVEIKLENTDNFGIDGGQRYQRRRGHVNKAKGKKWKLLARERRLEKNDNSQVILEMNQEHERDDKNVNTSSVKFEKEGLENTNIEDESSKDIKEHESKSEETTIAEKQEMAQTMGEVKEKIYSDTESQETKEEAYESEF